MTSWLDIDLCWKSKSSMNKSISYYRPFRRGASLHWVFEWQNRKIDLELEKESMGNTKMRNWCDSNWSYVFIGAEEKFVLIISRQRESMETNFPAKTIIEVVFYAITRFYYDFVWYPSASTFNVQILCGEVNVILKFVENASVIFFVIDPPPSPHFYISTTSR